MRLGPADRRDAAVAACLLPVVWGALRIPRVRLLQSLPSTAAAQSLDHHQLEQTRALAKLVNSVAASLLGPNQCLTRSLVLQWMLRRRGVASQLRIGVKRHHQQLSAHAWVECRGVPVNDKSDVADEYAVFGDTVRMADFVG